MAEMVEAIGFDPMNLWIRLLLAQLIFLIMKKSLIINLYGGPGSGKSTCAAYIFSQLKMHNINAELITEQTKEEAYKQNTEFFENQYYINYFINRPEYFQQEGRVHNKEQSKEIDNRIKNMLRDQGVNFVEIENTKLDEVVKQLLELINIQNKA